MLWVPCPSGREKDHHLVLFFLKPEKPTQPRQHPVICFLFLGMCFINHFLSYSPRMAQWVASFLEGEHLLGDAEWGQKCSLAPRPAHQEKPRCGPAWWSRSGFQPARRARALGEHALSRNAAGSGWQCAE